MSRIARLLACAAALGTASCAALLGFEHLSEDAQVAAEAGVDASIDADAAVDAGPPTSCSDIGLPAPPASSQPGEVEPVLSALRVLDFGIQVDGGAPTVPGFNLDQTCSPDIATSSCGVSVLPATFEEYAKDKANGVDNAGFDLIQYISRLSSVLSAEGINAGIAKGAYGGVIRVSQWNGQDDDDDVSVEIFPAIGFEARPDGGSETPLFDEDDVWQLDEHFRVGGVLDASTVKSDRAYVAGGRLVARFKQVTLPIKIDDDPKPFEVRIADAVFTGVLATLGPEKRTVTDGVIAGRWKSSDFLDQVRAIYIKDSSGLKNTFLCEAAAQTIYNAVKSPICDARDIRSDSQDNKALPCDAVSAAARISAYRVNSLGDFVPSFDAGVRCADAAVPSGDDCKN